MKKPLPPGHTAKIYRFGRPDAVALNHTDPAEAPRGRNIGWVPEFAESLSPGEL